MMGTHFVFGRSGRGDATSPIEKYVEGLEGGQYSPYASVREGVDEIGPWEDIMCHFPKAAGRRVGVTGVDQGERSAIIAVIGSSDKLILTCAGLGPIAYRFSTSYRIVARV
jgi:hypothetical protein